MILCFMLNTILSCFSCVNAKIRLQTVQNDKFLNINNKFLETGAKESATIFTKQNVNNKVDTFYFVVNGSTVLDVFRSDMKVGKYGKHSGPNQQFIETEVGDNKFMLSFIEKGNEKCMTVEDSIIFMRPCDKNNTKQVFRELPEKDPVPESIENFAQDASKGKITFRLQQEDFYLAEGIFIEFQNAVDNAVELIKTKNGIKKAKTKEYLVTQGFEGDLYFGALLPSNSSFELQIVNHNTVSLRIDQYCATKKNNKLIMEKCTTENKQQEFKIKKVADHNPDDAEDNKESIKDTERWNNFIKNKDEAYSNLLFYKNELETIKVELIKVKNQVDELYKMKSCIEQSCLITTYKTPHFYHPIEHEN